MAEARGVGQSALRRLGAALHPRARRVAIQYLDPMSGERIHDPVAGRRAEITTCLYRLNSG